MSLPELKKLNQFRIFSTGFEHLQPGDDIDVPLSVTSEDNKQHDKDEQQAQQLAGYAMQTGSFLASGVNGDAAAAMARGMATGATSAGVQQWLSHFGTARVQLDMDENFSLKNSQFDLLAPLWEQQDMLAFTQGSLHRTDDRTQSSLGFGFRWFSDSWMLGSNTFVDYDLSRDHARAGMGMEYWRDYLKMGANSYLRLTNWKNSPDLNGYEERPADGWDLRTQAWLPALPQLGGKLTYEQYYGNEVALFGKDKRQRDPHAFTFGLDYTPVPLVTLNAEQRQGKAGENDTRFGLALRYQPGTPWRQQVDPDAVAVMRSLAGSRHDLVERNNNIILEYRRKDDIRLRTVSLVTGYAGEKKSLGVSVTSHNGLERIDWSAPALLAAGGKIVQDDPQNYSVVLPAYQFEQGINNYTVTGVAVDSKGHRSNTSETQISVHAPTVSQTSSTFMPLNSALVADGHSSQLLTLTLRSGQGEILDAPVAEISIRPDRLKSATVSEVSKKEPGVYEVTVTAGTDEETLLLTPEVFGTTLNAARITISRIGLSDTRSTITTDKDSVIANDSATVALKFTAKDMNDTPVTGLATQVTFRVLDSNNNAVTGPAVTTGVTSEDKPGVYMASLKGTKAGHYTVIPLYNDQPVGALSTGVDLTPGPVDGENSHFELPDGGTVAADGLSTLTLRFTALDIYGNPVTGQEQKVTFSVQEKTRPNTGLHMDAGSPVTVGATTEQGNGVYTAKLSGTRAGIWTVTPVYDGQVLATLGQDVTLSAGEVDEGQSDFILPGATTAQADGTSPVALKFTAKDMNGNPVAGQAAKVSFRVLNAESNPVTDDSVKVSTATESSPGAYVANISGTKAGDYTVTPVYDNQPLESRRTDFSLTAGGVNGAHSSFVPTGGSTATADGNATVALQFAARDMNNNLVTGLAPQLTFRVQNGNAPVTDDSVTVDAATENSPGVYTANLKGTKAGEYTVSVLYGGSPVDVQGVKVTLTAGEVDSGASHFDLSGDNTVGDDEASRVKLTFTANDVNGNPVTGQKQKVTFRVLDSNQMEAGAAVTVDTTTEESPGLYTAMLYGTKAGTWTVMPVYDGQALTTLGKVVTLSAGAVDEGKSGFIPTGVTSVPADGTSPVVLQFTPADMYGNPVTGQATKVTFRVLNAESHPVTDDSVTVSTATEGSPGVYTANLSGTKAGHYTVIPEYDSQPLTGLHVEATLTAGDMDGAQSVFMASGSSTVPADDSSTVTLQFTAKDMNGNPVTGLTSLLAFTVVDNESHPVSSPAVTVGAATEGNDGIYTANLKGQKAGEYTVTVLYNGSPVDDVQGIKVTLTAGEVDKAFSTLTLPGAGSALADGAAPVALQFMARDVNNNPVTDQAAKVTFRVMDRNAPVTDGSVTVDAATENPSGVYTANLKGKKAGEYTVTVLY
ncbi:inverse autotransporter beta domain-containing protein, partial [Enterobacter ludwigii]|uniref:inverse autotransporter beta domain-containing protein n=1 Tax=Enterobacter ludwigii TaxID=299767 RepID=UPI003BF99CB5